MEVTSGPNVTFFKHRYLEIRVQLSSHFKLLLSYYYLGFFELSSDESLALCFVLHFNSHEVDRVADLAEKFTLWLSYF